MKEDDLLFRVESDKRRATLCFKSFGSEKDIELIIEAIRVAYKNNVCFSSYKDDANSVVIFFSGKTEEGIKKIGELYK